jgi:hypothetical protein
MSTPKLETVKPATPENRTYEAYKMSDTKRYAGKQREFQASDTVSSQVLFGVVLSVSSNES